MPRGWRGFEWLVVAALLLGLLLPRNEVECRQLRRIRKNRLEDQPHTVKMAPSVEVIDLDQSFGKHGFDVVTSMKGNDALQFLRTHVKIFVVVMESRVEQMKKQFRERHEINPWSTLVEEDFILLPAVHPQVPPTDLVAIINTILVTANIHPVTATNYKLKLPFKKKDCYAHISHAYALQRYIEETFDDNQFLVVLEDDVILHNSFESRLAGIVQLLMQPTTRIHRVPQPQSSDSSPLPPTTHPIDCVSLGYAFDPNVVKAAREVRYDSTGTGLRLVPQVTPQPQRSPRPGQEHTVRSTENDIFLPWGTMGYLVTRGWARKSLKGFGMDIDDCLKGSNVAPGPERRLFYPCQRHLVIPPIVLEDSDRFTSLMGHNASYLSSSRLFAKDVSARTDFYIPIAELKKEPTRFSSRCIIPGVLALTFDDGPTEFTSYILQMLKIVRAKATFFTAGNYFPEGYGTQNLSRGGLDFYSEVVLEAVKAGHQVAHHTFAHLRLSNTTSEVLREDTATLKKKFDSLLGKSPTYFRAPYVGHQISKEHADVLAAFGVKNIIGWSISTEDWKEVTKEGMSSVLRALADDIHVQGHILLMHDSMERTAHYIVPKLLKWAAMRQIKLVTVGECIGDPDPSHWYTDT